MKKFLTILCLLFCTYDLLSQENKGVLKFFVIENQAIITKDSLFAIGQISINNENFKIIQFTYLIDGFCINESGAVKYGIVKGSKFSTQMIEDIKMAPSNGRSNLIILDVHIVNKTRENSSTIKLNESFKINLKNK